LVIIIAAGAALALIVILRQVKRPHRKGLGAALLATSVLALALDTWVLPRLYPAFHVGLALIAFVGALLGARAMVDDAGSTPWRRVGVGLAGVSIVAMVISLPIVLSAANTTFA